MNKSIFSLAFFIFSYVLFVVLPAKRSFIASAASILLIITNTISFKEVSLAVNWNVMDIFVGALIRSSYVE